MKEERFLYQLKTLEKLIIRNLILEDEIHHFQTLTPTQVQIMEYILEHPNEEVYQKDLEKILNLRRATVSGVLQTMEKNGLLEREKIEEDARIKKVILNKKAKELLKEKQKQIETLEKKLIQNIGASELSTFSSVLNTMITNIQNIVYEKKGE